MPSEREIEAAAEALEAAHCEYHPTKADYREMARAALEASERERWPGRTLDAATVAALLRIAIQSFDSGGESMRSLRAQAIETVWHDLFDVDDQAFEDANRRCDADQWEFFQQARLRQRGYARAPPTPRQSRSPL